MFTAAFAVAQRKLWAFSDAHFLVSLMYDGNGRWYHCESKIILNKKGFYLDTFYWKWYKNWSIHSNVHEIAVKAKEPLLYALTDTS